MSRCAARGTLCVYMSEVYTGDGGPHEATAADVLRCDGLSTRERYELVELWESGEVSDEFVLEVVYYAHLRVEGDYARLADADPRAGILDELESLTPADPKRHRGIQEVLDRIVVDIEGNHPPAADGGT